MCLAIPAQITEFINEDRAMADFGHSVKREVGIALVPGLHIGDWVMIHTGYAVSKVEPKEAKEILALWEEINMTTERE